MLSLDAWKKLLDDGYIPDQKELFFILSANISELLQIKTKLDNLESYVNKLSDEESKSFAEIKSRIQSVETGGKSFLDI